MASHWINYLTLIGFGVLALAIACTPLLIARILSPHKPSELKQATYECGLEATGDVWGKFKMQYYLYALVFISSSEAKTAPVGIVTELIEGDVYRWGSLMAGALFGSLPVAILYSFFVEHYVASMTGAVKE